MPYKVFTTKQAAVDYSEQAGKDAGLSYHTGEGQSRYLWRVITHPETGEGACVCPEGETSREELIEDGWYPGLETDADAI